MPHAPTDAPPRRKRPPAPPPRPRSTAPAPTTAQQGVAALLGHHAATDTAAPLRTPPSSTGIVQQRTPFTHDTPPVAPTPTYGPGRLSRPTSTLDQVLARGKGPLALPKGKLDIPQASHAPVDLRSFVPQTPATGAHRDATPEEVQQAIQQATERGRVVAQRYPSWAQSGIQQASVADALTRLAMGTNLDDATARKLWDALGGLPDEQQARIFQGLPGVSPGLKKTIAQLYKLGHPGGIQGLANNFVSDALRTPQGVGLGSVATGSALWDAAHGNTDPIREVGGAAISPFTSWSNFKHSSYQHPFQALLALSGAGRAFGAVAGTAGRAGLLGTRAAEALSGEAPRTITETFGSRTLPGGEVTDLTKPHQVGTYSRNAVEQLIQRGLDRAGHASKTIRGRKIQAPFIGTNARMSGMGEDLANLARTELDVIARDRTLPVIEAGHRVSRPEQMAAIYAQGTRVKPSEWVTHYQQEVAEIEKRLSASTGTRVVDKTARGELSTRLDTARAALKTWEKVFKKTGDVLTPRAQKLALAARRAAGQRERQLASDDLLDPEQSAARILQPSSVITGEPRPGGFFTHAELLRRGATRGERARPTGSGKVSSLLPSTGEGFRSGNVDFGAAPFLQSLVEPERLLYAKRQLEEIKRLGIRVQPGDKISPDHILVRIKTRVRDAQGVFKPQSLIDRNTLDTDTVPPGNWLAVNRHAIKPLEDRLRKSDPSTRQQAARLATQAFKWDVLMTRPAWLVSNVVGNTAQAALAGVGPVSAYRALDRSGPISRHLPGRDYGGVIPRNVPYQGFFARQLAPKRGILPRSDRIPENPLAKWNVTNENWLRRATYLRHAIGTPLGRKLGITTKDLDALTTAKTSEERAPEVVKIVDRFLGNFGKHNVGENATIAIPFIRWLSFITKQTLIDLPLHHPARALLLYRLGTLGELASAQAEGLGNPSIEGGIPLPSSVLDWLGQPRQGIAGPVSAILRTGSLNPWATVSNLAGFSPTEPTGQPDFSGLLGAFNPFLQAGVNTATGREFSNPDFTTTRDPNTGTRASYFGNELLNLTPAVRLAFGNTRFGSPRKSPLSQPTPSFWTRLLGYNLAGVSPVDTTLMNAKNLNTLIRRYGEEQR